MTPGDERAVTVFACGPQSAKCRCNCNAESRDCEHKWDGPWKELERGGSVTCSRCGMTAIDHDMWVGP